MPTYKIDIDNVKPNIRNGGYVASVPLNIGNAKNIDSVLCGISSGEATFNFSFDDDIDTSTETITDFDNFSSDLLWHLRSEDLGTVYSNSSAVTDFWSYLEAEHRFTQNDTSYKPSYYSGTYGINNSLGTLSNPSLHLSGVPNDHMLNNDGSGNDTEGTFELDGASSFTIVVACGDKSFGSYRPFMGEQSSGSVGTVYGDWGRFKIRQYYPYEYSHSGALAAANQIRVCTVTNTSQTAADVTEHINGTGVVNSSISIDRQEPWKFTMLGGFQYVTGSGTYRTVWGGGLTEIMLFNGALTDDERELIEGYVAHKYSVEVNLPSAHPYKTTDPNPTKPTFEMTSDASLTSSTNTVKTYSTPKQIFHGKQVHLFLPKAQNPGNINFALTAS